MITRAEHEEFAKRLEDQKSRWDKRLELLETEVKELRKLTTSVEKLAQSVETFAAELKKQGERLQTLENRDNGGFIRSMDNADLAAFLTNPPPLPVGQSWLDWLNAPAT